MKYTDDRQSPARRWYTCTQWTYTCRLGVTRPLRGRTSPTADNVLVLQMGVLIFFMDACSSLPRDGTRPVTRAECVGWLMNSFGAPGRPPPNRTCVVTGWALHGTWTWWTWTWCAVSIGYTHSRGPSSSRGYTHTTSTVLSQGTSLPAWLLRCLPSWLSFRRPRAWSVGYSTARPHPVR
jgi:hypothetical protein